MVYAWWGFLRSNQPLTSGILATSAMIAASITYARKHTCVWSKTVFKI